MKDTRFYKLCRCLILKAIYLCLHRARLTRYWGQHSCRRGLYVDSAGIWRYFLFGFSCVRKNNEGIAGWYSLQECARYQHYVWMLITQAVQLLVLVSKWSEAGSVDVTCSEVQNSDLKIRQDTRQRDLSWRVCRYSGQYMFSTVVCVFFASANSFFCP